VPLGAISSAVLPLATATATAVPTPAAKPAEAKPAAIGASNSAPELALNERFALPMQDVRIFFFFST
jgi:hypothetical protein